MLVSNLEIELARRETKYKEPNMKFGVIGAGNVGATIAHLLVMKQLGDVYLLDIMADMAKGKAIDLNQSKFLFKTECKVEGGDDYNEILDSDFIIITAGLARKPGMSRDDLLMKNFEIIKKISLKIKNSKKNPYVIVVSNPLDIMTYAVYKLTGFPKNKVIGMAGVLDTYRFMHYIQNKLSTKTPDIEALTLGSHGDTMVPVSSLTKVEGKDISSCIKGEELTDVEEKTKQGGAEIVGLLKTGSAYYAPAASVVRMVESIVNNEGAMLPCSVFAEGEYGIKDVFIGLPSKLDKSGLAGIIDLKLSDKEKSELADSAKAISGQIDKIRDKC